MHGELIVAEKDVEKWSWVSVFSLPDDERLRLYQSIHYQEECVDKPKQQKQAHAAAKLKREEAAALDAGRKQLKKAALQALHLTYKRATSVEQLRGMLSKAAKSESAQKKVLAQQIAIRKHVNQIAHPVRKGHSSMKAAELQQLVEEMVEGERYSKPAVVKVEALKPRKETQFPDSYTRWLDAARKERAEQKAQELEAMVADGSFLALTKRKPSNKNKKKTATAAKAARRKAAPAPRQPTAAQATALDGATFEDDGISWRVLKVEWSDEYESILVYYYDVWGR